MTLLVTGFGPFGDVADNPSARLVRALATEPDVYARVLDTSYIRAARRLCQLIDELRPSYVVSFGVGRSRATMELERTARNRNACQIPDADGDLRTDQPIAPAFGDLHSAADVPTLAAQLGLGLSDDAGGYVCNHLYFEGLRHLHGTPAQGRMLFAHIPPTGDWLPHARALLAAVRAL
jgi:pyroglutamyl-peptidase